MCLIDVFVEQAVRASRFRGNKAKQTAEQQDCEPLGDTINATARILRSIMAPKTCPNVDGYRLTSLVSDDAHST